MINNTSGFSRDIQKSGQDLDTVSSFKLSGAVVTDEESRTMLPRITQSTAILKIFKAYIMEGQKLHHQFKNETYTNPDNIYLYMYACQIWMLTADLERKFRTKEMGIYKKLLCISQISHQQ